MLLAMLGLSALRADRLEREQQLREQQGQTARLANAAIENAIEHATAVLYPVSSDSFASTRDPANELRYPVFLLDKQGFISFPSRRVYFGPAGTRPEFLERAGQLSPAASQLVWQAEAMEAQHHTAEAIERYREASRNPALKDWADLALDRLAPQAEEISRIRRLADPRRARSEATTPSGIPLAIVASSAVEQVEPRYRSLFATSRTDAGEPWSRYLVAQFRGPAGI
jgi:hypothetical protein